MVSDKDLFEQRTPSTKQHWILRSIPCRCRVRNSFSVPPIPLLCKLVCAWPPPPPFVCTARTQMCAHVKDAVSICRKRVGLTADGMETQKLCAHWGRGGVGGGGLVSAVLGLLAFPVESSPNFPCINVLGQESYLMSYLTVSPLRSPLGAIVDPLEDWHRVW